MHEFGMSQEAAIQRGERTSIVVRAIQEMHWISIVCFLEQVSHADLKLTPQIASRIGAELDQLRRYEPLEAYAAALDYLCADRQKKEDQIDGAPEDSFHAEY